jgi:hypothetical protein
MRPDRVEILRTIHRSTRAPPARSIGLDPDGGGGVLDLRMARKAGDDGRSDALGDAGR